MPSPATANVERERDPLIQALQILSHLIGSVMPRADEEPMPISRFKAKYSTILKQADVDGIALISQNGKRYVIVGEDHMVTLTSNERTMRSVADICRSLPRPRQAVEMTTAQMTGAGSDIQVPAKRL
jgi:hypothetical protein